MKIKTQMQQHMNNGIQMDMVTLHWRRCCREWSSPKLCISVSTSWDIYILLYQNQKWPDFIEHFLTLLKPSIFLRNIEFLTGRVSNRRSCLASGYLTWWRLCADAHPDEAMWHQSLRGYTTLLFLPFSLRFMKQNEWCYRPSFCSVRLYWVGEYLI